MVNRADGPFLVAVNMRNLRRDDLPHVRVENTVVDQLVDRVALPKATRQG